MSLTLESVVAADKVLLPVWHEGLYHYLTADGETAIEVDYERASGFSGDVSTVLIGGRWTLIDRKGNERLRTKVDFIAAPSEGHAMFLRDGLYGFLDANGKETVEAAFEDAFSYSDGLAGVMKEGSWGFIDSEGVIRIPFVYDDVRPFSDGLARVKMRGQWGLIDTKGGQKLPNRFEALGRCCLLDPNLSLAAFARVAISDEVVELEDCGDFSEGLAAAQYGGLWGFIGRDGEWRIAPRFDRVREFSEGKAAFSLGGKWGYVNDSGGVVIPPQFDEARSFREKRAIVKQDNKFQILDERGNPYYTAPQELIFISDFSEGTCVMNGNGKWSILNGPQTENLKWESLKTFITELGPKKEGYYLGYNRDEQSYQLMDDEFRPKWTVPSGAQVPWDMSEGWVVFWGRLREEARIVYGYASLTVEPNLGKMYGYDFAWPVKDGLGRVKKFGKVGFARPGLSGFAIYPKFESARDFNDGLAAAKLNGKWGYFDPTGAEAIDPRYVEARSFSQGRAAVRLNEGWNFIDTSGIALRIVAPDVVSEEAGSIDSSAWVPAMIGGRWGVIDLLGRWRIAPDESIDSEPLLTSSEAVVSQELGRVRIVSPSGGTATLTVPVDEVRDLGDGVAAVRSGDQWRLKPRGGSLAMIFGGDAKASIAGLAIHEIGGLFAVETDSGLIYRRSDGSEVATLSVAAPGRFEPGRSAPKSMPVLLAWEVAIRIDSKPDLSADVDQARDLAERYFNQPEALRLFLNAAREKGDLKERAQAASLVENYQTIYGSDEELEKLLVGLEKGQFHPAWRTTPGSWGLMAPLPGFKSFLSVSEVNVPGSGSFPTEGLSWSQTNVHIRKQKKRGHEVRSESLPTEGLSWFQASAFCRQLTNAHRAAGFLDEWSRFRLPLDREWSAAAGLRAETGGYPAARRGRNTGQYPWGAYYPPPPGTANVAGKEVVEGLVGVPNALGFIQLAGNVGEWCEERLVPWRPERVVRGSYYEDCNAEYFLSSHRGAIDSNAPEARSWIIGHIGVRPAYEPNLR